MVVPPARRRRRQRVSGVPRVGGPVQNRCGCRAPAHACGRRRLRSRNAGPRGARLEPRRNTMKSASVAAALAFASAAVSLYWSAGGTWLLDTVGGPIEELARDRSLAGIALGLTAVAIKVFAGVLALALRHPPLRGTRRRLLLIANAAAAVILCAWGGANVAVGSLALGGAITPAGDVDRHAPRWHVLLWDLWFLLWGVALAVAVTAARSHGSGSRTRQGR